jgi:glutathione S-transferase
MKQPVLRIISSLLLFINVYTCNGLASSTSSVTRFITNKMCPFAQKAWIALEVSRAEYELEQVSLYGAGGKPDWFWKLNPQGTVPILVCSDGIVLPDSDMILNEISKVPGGEPLIPSVAESKAIAESFRRTLSELLPIGKSAVLGGDKTNMWRKLKELDAIIIGPYVCGEEITVADCAGFPFLWRLENEYGSLAKYNCSNLSKWLKVCKGNPAFSKTIQTSWWWWW